MKWLLVDLTLTLSTSGEGTTQLPLRFLILEPKYREGEKRLRFSPSILCLLTDAWLEGHCGGFGFAHAGNEADNFADPENGAGDDDEADPHRDG
jgi:hypothetical protein